VVTFRPDSPLNRLVLLWPGVPVAACALGFSLSLEEVARSGSASFAVLAIAMGCGLALSLGLVFHIFFIAWLEVSLTVEGIALRPVGFAWIRSQPRVIPWSQVRGAQEVTAVRGGPQLTIAADDQLYRLPRMLFRDDTYVQLCRLLTSRLHRRQERDPGLAAA